jgi:hypothetical protein
MTALWVLVGVIVGGMLLRMPIGFSMIASGIAYLLVKGQDVGLVAEQIGNGLYNSYVLLAVPLFVFAANIMNAGTVSERIFDFCRILVGRMRGGLAQVDILVSVIFSGMSGSAIADAAGPGLVTIRQMLKKPEYTRGFAGAVVVASATLGPIIPPSIPMVIYALVSGASVGALFLGGVVPGLLMASLMMVVVHIIAVKRNMPRDEPVPRSEWAGLIFSRRAAAVDADRAAGRHLLRGVHAHRGGGRRGAAFADPGHRVFPRADLAQLLGRGAGVGPRQRRHHHDPGGLLHAELRLHRRRCAAGHGAMGRQHAAGARSRSCCW